MGIIKAFTGALTSTIQDQWKDIITVRQFDEHTVVAPGVFRSFNNGNGTNYYQSDGIVTNGSKIYVPENTAAFIFDQSGIEEIITEPGGYEYQNGQESIFNKESISKSILSQVAERFTYGGISSDYKDIAYVNLKEIRDIKFGTRGAQVYHDIFYDTDLEIFSYGSFTIKVTDAKTFIRNFVPANVTSYSFDDEKVREQLVSEFLQSFIVALNSLSESFRISQLPSQANKLSNTILSDSHNAGSWKDRFGFSIIHVSIENIEFTPESKELVRQYSMNKMNMKAYEDISQKTSNIVAQQKIAQGIQDNGFGEMGNMIMGMNLAQGINGFGESELNKTSNSIDSQIENVKKLKSLLDAGILTEEEFQIKKKEIMGL